MAKETEDQNNVINWDEITITDPYLFASVMLNEKRCKQVLELIFGKGKVSKIEYLEMEKTIHAGYETKGVRLDIYVKDEHGVVYNVELQMEDTKELEKRTRIYQVAVDSGMLKKGQDYIEIKDSYIIFISPRDIFKQGHYRYDFENMCLQVEGLKLNDGAYKIFFYTKGTKGEVSPEMKAFLDYIEGIESDDPFVQELIMEVERIKQNEEWRKTYMTQWFREQDKYFEGQDAGIEIGLAKGLERGKLESAIEIAKKLLSLGLSMDQVRVGTGLSAEEVEKLSA